MSSRTERAAIARETLEILEKGKYKNEHGELVDLQYMLDFARSNSIHYKPDMFDAVFSRRNKLLRVKKVENKTIFEVRNETTLSAARRLVVKKGHADVACLNFASARNPGGGFLKGSGAQEESLARASGLFPCIAQMRGYYEANKRFRSNLYLDHLIYSPMVPVFRDDDGGLLDSPYRLSIITAPAVNAGAVRRNEPKKISFIKQVMVDRIEKILSLGVIHGHSVLVLGAWGCGVFRNNPDDVARYFHGHLAGSGLFKNAFQKIVFAILDNSRSERILRPFSGFFLKEKKNKNLSSFI
ncbi:MAG: TIGR02452 family protein [Candidatus Helarchaeota archaeon]